MKHFFLLVLLSSYAWGGPRVGNGGGSWACLKNQDLEWIRLVDLFEAQFEFGLNLFDHQDQSHDEIYKTMYDRLNKSKHLYPHNLHLHLANVRKIMKLVTQSEFTLIEDAHFRIFPAVDNCPQGEIVYLQIANFTEDGRLLIRQDLWQKLSNTDQVALIFHEALYSLFRELYADETSDRARRAVGLIFSDLPVEKLEKELNRIHFLARSPHGNPLHEDALPFIFANVEVKNYITKNLDRHCVEVLPMICGNQIYFQLFSILPQDGRFVGEPRDFRILLPYIIRYQLRGHEHFCDVRVEILQERNVEGVQNQLKSLNFSCFEGGPGR